MTYCTDERSKVSGSSTRWGGIRIRSCALPLAFVNDFENPGAGILEIQGRRGAILNMTQEGDVTDIEAKTPVAELFGFAGDLRSATEGRALWSTEFAGFEPLPKNLLPEIVSQIRTRKGLKPGIPKAADFVSQ
jgi:elongation factor 2